MSKHLPSLDGWRAIAICLVIISHFEYATGFPSPLLVWWGRVFQGKLGVRIFFVISGYLITHLLLRESLRSGKPSLKNFYVRRVLRIFPVYYLYVAVVALLSILGLYSDALSTWIGTLTFNRDLVGLGRSVTTHFWSLGVEEKFYLGWPITFVLLRLWDRTRIAVLMLCIPIICCPFLRTGIIQAQFGHGILSRLLGPNSIALYADGLAIGCLGAILSMAYPTKAGKLISGPVLWSCLTSFLLGAYWMEWHGGTVGYALIPSLQAIALVVALWITINRHEGLLYRFLNLRPIAWLGVLSYSFYVWQQLFVGHFAGEVLGSLWFYDWRIWWVPALGIACASYYGVERPFLKLKERIAN